MRLRAYGIASPIAGCAASGNLLAFVLIAPPSLGWQILPDGTRQFHLSDRSQEGVRKLGAQIHEFVTEVMIDTVVFSRTSTGYGEVGLASESKIETLLQLIPGLTTTVIDSHEIAQWVLENDPPIPANIASVPRGLAGARALEIAQYCVLQF